jgi:hypothetical protein
MPLASAITMIRGHNPLARGDIMLAVPTFTAPPSPDHAFTMRGPYFLRRNPCSTFLPHLLTPFPPTSSLSPGLTTR